MSHRSPFPFQLEASEHLLAGRSVILRAPTGSGKTRAALMPYLHARRHPSADIFPRKCIYSVPLRVLADQFEASLNEQMNEIGYGDWLDVSVQTGARQDDPKLEGDVIFTTIDQTLSNFLTIPYALSLGQGNIN